jgi:hypothetical protein
VKGLDLRKVVENYGIGTRSQAQNLTHHSRANLGGEMNFYVTGSCAGGITVQPVPNLDSGSLTYATYFHGNIN